MVCPVERSTWKFLYISGTQNSNLKFRSLLHHPTPPHKKYKHDLHPARVATLFGTVDTKDSYLFIVMDDAGRFGVPQKIRNGFDRWRTHKTIQGKLRPDHENSICHKYSSDHNKYHPIGNKIQQLYNTYNICTKHRCNRQYLQCGQDATS